LQLLEEFVTLTPALERRISILVYNDLEAAYHYLVFGSSTLEPETSPETIRASPSISAPQWSLNSWF